MTFLQMSTLTLSPYFELHLLREESLRQNALEPILYLLVSSNDEFLHYDFQANEKQKLIMKNVFLWSKHITCVKWQAFVATQHRTRTWNCSCLSDNVRQFPAASLKMWTSTFHKTTSTRNGNTTVALICESHLAMPFLIHSERPDASDCWRQKLFLGVVLPRLLDAAHHYFLCCGCHSFRRTFQSLWERWSEGRVMLVFVSVFASKLICDDKNLEEAFVWIRRVPMMLPMAPKPVATWQFFVFHWMNDTFRKQGESGPSTQLAKKFPTCVDKPRVHKTLRACSRAAGIARMCRENTPSASQYRWSSHAEQTWLLTSWPRRSFEISTYPFRL